jgi:integrase
MQHAVEIGMRADDPTRYVRKLPTAKGDGYHSWTEGEIEQFERHHPVGSRARLAFALLLYTGQRRSDVVRMERQHLSDNAICVRQVKTGREVWVPVHKALASILAAAATNLTFLLTDQGKPYTAAGFGNWFRDQCRSPASTDAAPTASGRLRRGVWRKPDAAHMRLLPSPAMPASRKSRAIPRPWIGAGWRRPPWPKCEH